MLNRNPPGPGITSAIPGGRAGREDIAGRGAPPVASAVRDVCVQFELCRQFAANVHKAEANVAARIEQMLERVYELRRLTTSNPAAAPNSGRAFAFSASPADEITRLLLLFFPDGALKPAVLRRYAGTLWLAEREGIAPREFVRFVRRNGGVAGCGDRAARQMPR